MAVTIKDVAKLAGVSPATVSRALSMPDLVRPPTREKVQRAVAELGYQPNPTAQGLVLGRTGNLGLIVPDLTNPFFPAVVKGVQTRARDFEYSVFLADANEDPVEEAALVRALTKQVDGILLCAPRMSEDDLRALVGATPLVLINRRSGRIPAVTIDNLAGVRQAVSHLAALGHRRVAYVAGPRASWSNRERVRALRGAAAAQEVDLVEVGTVAPQFAGGVAAADLVLAAGVTAVMAYNDLIALGMLSRFTDRGIDVPGQISIIGFDGIAMAEMVSPPLTTVAQPQDQIGRVGVDLLLEIMRSEDPAVARRRELPAQLMVRGSTGVPGPVD
ncbi:LacI family transcriptional regulator [Krasilnikovia cinnamomea]|uniref:LacI family transcriptional regulator n=1 Tax=Krasilnikovia cinnamomea TaxID=349313 RepID=A0A4Q7ZQL3_9ACTN|nr:LacI family DNA-binding transcriptional regulator [Krasilnikovia cinnamomea]RZU53412.1 LacI family transcriptional regulator [Krasilnikovia cinnamomea]